MQGVSHGSKNSLATRFVIYYSLANSVFYIPILLFHAQTSGLSAGRALYLVTLFAAVVAVTEIPLGILADLVGLRLSLLFSAFCGGSAALTFAVASDFRGFALGQIWVALAMSSSSGTASAYLFELCQAQELEYERLESQAASARYLALGTAGLIGGVLYGIDHRLPFWASALTMVLAMATLWRLPAVDRRPSGGGRSMIGLIRDARRLASAPKVLPTLLYGAIFLAVTGTLYWSYQPLLAGFGVAPQWLGGLYGVFFLLAALGSRCANRLDIRLGYRRSAPWLGILLAAAILALAAGTVAVVVLGTLIVQFLHGWADPTLRVMLQKRIESASRATLLSMRSMGHRALLAVVSAILGHLADLGGLGFALLALSLGMAVVAATIGRSAGAALE